MERKLSTILASDVVGFSKMMAKNEEITLETLKKRRLVIDGLIAEFGGKIFGSAGDSVIAEFPSPIKATECAVKIQHKMQVMNTDQHEEEQMIFRVGINIGDVMVAQENLFGDAVNIAARLEAEALPSGICVSQSVFDMVGQKLKISFKDAGKLELKNIEGPVQAYFVIPGKGAGRYLQNSETPKIKLPKAETGSIAIMLFKNLSADEEQEYFCEGFSEDLVSALSRFKKLLVVSGNASFSYKDSTKSPREIGKELAVRYIVEGSVRKLGNKIRISSTLISVERENTIWSNKFDTTIDDVFDIQDELVETIVSTVVGRVEADAVQHLFNSRPENLAAYDLVLKGLDYHRRCGIIQENAEKAFELFDKAIGVDPSYARAYAWRACSMANVSEWTPDRFGKNWIEECLSSVSHALELDPDDAEVHRILGAIKFIKGEFESARYHCERATELCPSDAFIIARYATLLIYLGEPEKAIIQINHAKRINPFCPDILFEDEGMCYFWLTEYPKSIETFGKLKVPTRNSMFYLAASLIKNNELEKAKETLKQAILISNLSTENFIKTQSYQKSEQIAELEDVLKMIELK